MLEEVQSPQVPADAGGSSPGTEHTTSNASPFDQQPLPTLERMEHHLAALHGALDASARESEHQEFSPARLTGAVLEVIVAGLIVLALLDWLLQVEPMTLLIKLAFAVVFQLVALTAFILAPR